MRHGPAPVGLANVTMIIAVVVSLAPIGGAQPEPAQGLVIDVEDRASGLPLSGGSPLNYTVSVGCADLAKAVAAKGEPGTKASVSVSATGPTWLTFSSGAVEFDLAACTATPQEAQGTLTSTEQTLTVAAISKAPGLKSATVTVTALLDLGENEEPLDATDTTDLRVVYAPGFSVTTEPRFPLTVRNETVSFTVVVTIRANADTAAMFNQVTDLKFGNLTGFPPAMKTYVTALPNATEVVDRIPVTYKATGHDWTTDYANFTSMSHPGSSMSKVYTGPALNWAFTNGDVHAHNEKKDSPGLGVLFMLGGAVGAVAWLRRRA